MDRRCWVSCSTKASRINRLAASMVINKPKNANVLDVWRAVCCQERLFTFFPLVRWVKKQAEFPRKTLSELPRQTTVVTMSYQWPAAGSLLSLCRFTVVMSVFLLQGLGHSPLPNLAPTFELTIALRNETLAFAYFIRCLLIQVKPRLHLDLFWEVTDKSFSTIFLQIWFSWQSIFRAE